MNLGTRKILFLSFVFAFAVITPLVSLYAAGYKFSFSGKILQKTGMLIVDSDPTGADIYIDGEAQQKFINKVGSFISRQTKQENILKTPAKIKGLSPGTYTLSLKKDGHWSWTKDLRVYSGNSTFAEDVVLFKNNLPQPLAEGNILDLSESPGQDLLALLTEKDFVVFDKNNDEVHYYEISEENQNRNILWLDKENVLFGDILFSINNWNDPKKISFDTSSLAFDKIQPNSGDSFYFLKNNSISLIDLHREKLETIFSSQNILLDYLIKDGLLYTIESAHDEIFLAVHKDGERQRKINLNSDENNSFINPENDFINIYNSKFNTLHLIDPLDYFSPLKETINNVSGSFWANDYRLVYYNDFEIWTYDSRTYKKSILTRLSRKIEDVLWHPSNNYIIYSDGQSINTIELDQREHHNTNRLLEMNNIDFLKIKKTGDYLYFSAELGSKSGLFKLAI